ncbi:Transmembrane protein-like protein [Zostera marina]|uniref:Transmembrane protein-like protein n=1 Tax=Zostera marina TaxID=29655 RepID=A0A0K9NP43_ZOSMR|nr:Transmembrane protein-like protein [Zostera marina]
MANQGAKKRRDENKKHMSKLFRIIAGCNAIYVMVRMLFFHSTFNWLHWIGLIVTSACYFLPYQQLAKMAKPAYSDDGELIDGGYDMSTGGVCSYLHDVIYITSFVQLTSIYSGKFWYTYLVIPAFGLYQIFGIGKEFLSGSERESEEDDKTRKKRQKMEKRASRPKFVKGHR